MPDIVLTGLRGTDPRDVLAAQGLLAALSEQPKGAKIRKMRTAPTLRWTLDDPLALRPILHTSGTKWDLEAVLGVLDVDRAAWVESPVLHGDVEDLTLSVADAARWLAAIADADDPVLMGMARSLIDPDPLHLTSTGLVGRTPLHFTSGKQRWVRAARQLGEVTTPDHLRSALLDGTEKDDTLPSLRWGIEDSRSYGTSRVAPATERAARPVGKEWLAWRGLAAQPPAAPWPRGPMGFRWLLHAKPFDVEDLRRLNAAIAGTAPDVPMGIGPLMGGWAPVHRAEHGYGHFGGGAALRLAGSGPDRRRQIYVAFHVPGELVSPIPPQDIPLGIPEVAEMFSVERGTVDKWIQRGIMWPARWKVGGTDAWSYADGVAWGKQTGRW
ncbi:MAG TPA: hypothetical protein VHB02_05950 [Acidimicrobiales bacterium]|nr:hypothetical protein [Acidimicrobiales bacterium]